jgi:hypothetical protein
VRADDEKKFYLSPAIGPGELLSEIVSNGFLLTPWPEVTHRQLIRHDRSENFNGCGKCLALLISSSGSEVTVAAYSLRLPEPLSIS